MAESKDEVPPIVKKERWRGTLLTVLALGVLVLVALFILIGDEIFGAAPPEETNLIVHTGEK